MSKDNLKEIEKLRKKMIEVGMSKGFTHRDTVKLSKKLDKLLNEKMKMGGK